jgi:glycosyltransferase involved in cell wall biosynthesis
MTAPHAAAYATDRPRRFSVIIATRNHPDTLPTAVESVLACDYPAFDLTVVDQSDDDLSEQAIASYRGDPRLRYIRSMTVGLSVARNIALRASVGPLVAVTDDDTHVPPDWLTQFAVTFAAHPDVAVIFGSLIAGYDPTPGVIPEFVPPYTGLVRHLHPITTGFGGNIALRRSALAAVGHFDEHLGSGAIYPAAEEVDLAWRLMRAGFALYLLPESEVLHYGYRPPELAMSLVARSAEGTAALLWKQIRGGDLTSWLDVCRYHWAHLATVLRAVAHRHGPFHLRSLRTEAVAFARGFLTAARHPVDRERVVFLPQSWLDADRKEPAQAAGF